MRCPGGHPVEAVLRAGQGAVAEETFEGVRALEGRWAVEKDKEAGVFLLLH